MVSPWNEQSPEGKFDLLNNMENVPGTQSVQVVNTNTPESLLQIR